jgi:hypothetical protein
MRGDDARTGRGGADLDARVVNQMTFAGLGYRLWLMILSRQA